MMLVDRFKLPLPLKLLVNIGVHWLNGVVKLVVPSNTYRPLPTPFVALMLKFVPFTLMLVKCAGCAGGGATVNINPTMAAPLLSTKLPVYPGGRSARFKLLKGSVPV